MPVTPAFQRLLLRLSLAGWKQRGHSLWKFKWACCRQQYDTLLHNITPTIRTSPCSGVKLKSRSWAASISVRIRPCDIRSSSRYRKMNKKKLQKCKWNTSPKRRITTLCRHTGRWHGLSGPARFHHAAATLLSVQRFLYIERPVRRRREGDRGVLDWGAVAEVNLKWAQTSAAHLSNWKWNKTKIKMVLSVITSTPSSRLGPQWCRGYISPHVVSIVRL